MCLSAWLCIWSALLVPSNNAYFAFTRWREESGETYRRCQVSQSSQDKVGYQEKLLHQGRVGTAWLQCSSWKSSPAAPTRPLRRSQAGPAKSACELANLVDSIGTATLRQAERAPCLLRPFGQARTLLFHPRTASSSSLTVTLAGARLNQWSAFICSPSPYLFSFYLPQSQLAYPREVLAFAKHFLLHHHSFATMQAGVTTSAAEMCLTMRPR